jgi:hypothetical protein
MKTMQHVTTLAGAVLGAWLLAANQACAHCDTMDGPVVAAAKAALEKKDVTPVLKWIKKEAEAEIRAAFAKTLAVRNKAPEARELADQFFFETLVRVHRAGEGAPYTGLKPARADLGPAIAGAYKALETGNIDQVVKLITAEAAAGIRKRFAEAREKKAHAEQNVEAGREFVTAYVDYVHYIEGFQQAALGAVPHHEGDHEETQAKAEHKEPAQARALTR